jgi:hypothetical protein
MLALTWIISTPLTVLRGLVVLALLRRKLAAQTNGEF